MFNTEIKNTKVMKECMQKMLADRKVGRKAGRQATGRQASRQAGGKIKTKF